MGERGIIICPNCDEQELCCWPYLSHAHRCYKDSKQYDYKGGSEVLSIISEEAYDWMDENLVLEP